VISVDGESYQAHRLSWVYYYGVFPDDFLDHINRDPSSNQISNLREVSQQCNIRNTGNSKRNTSGIKGVRWVKPNKRWAAFIVVSQKNISVGYYKLFSNAVCARLAAEQCLGWSGCDSSSPAYKYVCKMQKEKK